MDAFDIDSAVSFWVIAALLMAASVGAIVFPLLKAASGAAAPRPHPRIALALALALPALAVGLYLAVGSPRLLDAAGGMPHIALADGQGGHVDDEMETLVARLAAKLKDNPGDGVGWALLARSYVELRQFPEAVRAFAKAVALDEGDAQLRADYADALDGLKAQVAARLPARAVAGASVSGEVSLARELAGKVSPSDTLFIYARPEGRRQPVAILSLTADRLPARFTLDDSLAMVPDAKLSDFREVVVVARVSKMRGAAPQPGDLVGASKKLAPGARDVRVVIDSTVP